MKKQLLLVDDEPGIRTFLGLSLTDLGYEVLTAENGPDALRVFDEAHPPIVLTDIKMPGMDGIELLKAIKAKKPDAEVIMISGHGDMDLAIQSLKFDAADFVTKPINDEVLEAALGRVVEKITMREKLHEYTVNLERLVEEKSARVVELERQVAVGQVVDGLASAIRGITDLVDDGDTFNAMPCFISVHNAYMEIVAVNQLYRAKLGDMVGRNSWDLYADPNAKDAGCPVGRTFATGRGQRARMTLRTPDNGEIPVIVHTAPILDQDGEVDLVLEITVDVTEIKRLQEELRATREKYQVLFDETPCFISVLDRQFRTTASNRLYNELFGGEPGLPCHQVLAHRDAPCDNCPAARTFSDGQTHQRETVITSRDGRQYNVLVWTAPLRNDKGEVAEVMELAADITQIRELQDHLASLGLMIGSMSHGIKGMLTALDGGIYRVESGMRRDDRDKIASGWETVKDLTGRIRSMVLQMLHYAKNRDLNWERVDVAEFYDAVAALVEPKATKTGVRFVRETDGEPGFIEADAHVLSAAFVNFLENAVDACVSDTTGDKEHAVTFGLTAEPQRIRITISDNGTGMDRETREKLFTLFFSSKGCRGTGLGLFVSDKSIRQHGGDIAVDSQPGQGTTFTITIPRRLPPEAKACETPCQ
ncbi:PAS domain S-box-containing protein [Desulfobaculum xiamenense]|uniref:histidine kinase n=1 Tax=Desulfobaculum xiamenense TaxID=995050 RepID=A0A846QPQ5_9BACT|nr:response regulator [Desulfobaculum xiamenense]NJB68482.1 PAS domain S-box-containing protein [Desulfobaculum xiamenense]